MSAQRVADVLILAGLAVIVAGIALVYPPAAVIAAGVGLVAFGALGINVESKP